MIKNHENPHAKSSDSQAFLLRCIPHTAIKNSPKLHRVFLAVTNECNGSCIYCANPAKNAPSLTKEKIIELIHDVSGMGAKELVITGGEPLLRTDLSEIIDCASNQHMNILIATNGIALSSEILSKIAGPNVRIQISLDSIDRRINDTLRGCGAYDGAMKAIKLCLAREIPLQISTTVSNLNYPKIPGVISFGFKKSVPVKLRQFVAKGRGKEIREKLMVDDEQLEKLLSDYVLNPAYKMLVSAEQMPFHKHNRIYRCSAGNSIMYIGSDGIVSACPSVNNAVGNINSKSIREIWSTSFNTFRNKNYKSCGFCGRTNVLLPENKSRATAVRMMTFKKFREYGCKCTG